MSEINTLAGDAAGIPAAGSAAEITFADLGLAPELLRAVTDQGYTKPTPIQAQAIPLVLIGGVDMHGRRPDRHRQDGRLRAAHAAIASCPLASSSPSPARASRCAP
jgi:ATP-dependent RNA helicase RhlE